MQPLSPVLAQATEQCSASLSSGTASPSSAPRRSRLGEQLDLGVEVVALAEHALGAHGERPQPVEPHARAQEASEPLPRRSHGGIADGELAEPLLPQPAALEVRPEGVELLERRVHAGLDGELAQQTAGEPVDGADGRVVERVERALDDRRARGVSGGLPRQPFELLADALAELAGCLLRERDRRHRAHVARPLRRVEDAVHVAVDEHAGLAGAGARLQQEGRAEVGGHPPADVLVADGALSRHRASSQGGDWSSHTGSSRSCSRLRALAQAETPQA